MSNDDLTARLVSIADEVLDLAKKMRTTPATTMERAEVLRIIGAGLIEAGHRATAMGAPPGALN